MPDPKIVELHPANNPNNIPEKLRELADSIENMDTPAMRVTLVIPVIDDFPLVFTWGAANNYVADAVYDLECAKAFLVNNVTKHHT
jgi:hypothetical protein